MLRETESSPHALTGVARSACASRLGVARLTKMAVSGADLQPLRKDLIAKLLDGTGGAGEGLDLSLIAQLLGDKQAGLAIQREILASHRLFRSPCVAEKPRLRVLALAAAADIGSNTPIEFLLEESEIELMTLYVIPEAELPEPLPDHDIAIVIASDSKECRDALCRIERTASRLPRPLLNPPHAVCNLDRDKLHRLLDGIDGLEIPSTTGITREILSELSCGSLAPSDIAASLSFPVIVRPRGSHAGAGLAKLDDNAAVGRYLDQHQEEEFFISRFVDYASDDGLYRKYRLVFVDGQPFACHMAIADRWDVWYLNSGMSASASKRREEAVFMRTFDTGFARRHEIALTAMADWIGLDYFTVDCAESKSGSLLVFEADNTAIVHNMDPPNLFPYKAPQMRKVFDAFAAMLNRRARYTREKAA
jgi:glutathione synthase/RimK-type ligase-like ATP-grasp enzyme